MRVSIYGRPDGATFNLKIFFKKDFEWSKFAPPTIGTIIPIKTAQGTIKGVVGHVNVFQRAILLNLANCSEESARYMLLAEGWEETSEFPR